MTPIPDGSLRTETSRSHGSRRSRLRQAMSSLLRTWAAQMTNPGGLAGRKAGVSDIFDLSRPTDCPQAGGGPIRIRSLFTLTATGSRPTGFPGSATGTRDVDPAQDSRESMRGDRPGADPGASRPIVG